MRTFRLLIDGPTDGVVNMAVDEAMLAAAHEHGAVPVLRWYRWSEPTLSLGYFQRWNDLPAELQALPRVRRSTGGGAILHDEDELTYSIVFPTGTLPRKLASEVVADVHVAVAGAFRGRACARFAEGEQARPRTDEPFLCFDRRSPNDLVVGADKIMGSAQRRQGGNLLQHGSIKLREMRPEKLIKAATKDLADRWLVEFSPSTLTNREQDLVEEMAAKHRSVEWTQRR
jgi:lipoyl(octanoyl) transferase